MSCPPPPPCPVRSFLMFPEHCRVLGLLSAAREDVLGRSAQPSCSRDGAGVLVGGSARKQMAGSWDCHSAVMA